VLYLDSSALIKHYVQEPGTREIDDKLKAEEIAGRPLFTSVITYAEIHRALARRMKDGSLIPQAFLVARREFDADWLSGLTTIELRSDVLVFIQRIVEQFPLKSSDAMHLASAFSLRDRFRLSGRLGAREVTITFATADRELAGAALASYLEVFNPETAGLP
jgi:predicted nucleic acid-binding protein